MAVGTFKSNCKWNINSNTAKPPRCISHTLAGWPFLIVRNVSKAR